MQGVKYVWAYTSFASYDEAREIAKEATLAKLVFCVHILPKSTSIYPWEGQVCEESEVVAIFKTSCDLWEDVLAFIKAKHSYEVPGIWRIEASSEIASYNNWAKECLQPF